MLQPQSGKAKRQVGSLLKNAGLRSLEDLNHTLDDGMHRKLSVKANTGGFFSISETLANKRLLLVLGNRSVDQRLCAQSTCVLVAETHTCSVLQLSDVKI